MSSRTADTSQMAQEPHPLQRIADTAVRPSREPHTLQAFSDAVLRAAARSWYLTAVIGQFAFALYIVSFYGRTTMHGDWKAWNTIMTHGYIPGAGIGNAVVAVHLLLAFVINLSGALQLIPRVRERAPAFHRLNGRVYILAAFTISIAGLFMLWTRGTVGDVSQHIGTSMNAVLIFLCAALALRYALTRNFHVHRQWALRLFMVVSGVWFFRVGLMFWLLFNHGPVGFDPKTFVGPFLTFLTFAQYLLPLAVLQLYFLAQDRAGAPARIVMAAGLFALTVAMGVGIFGAAMGMWLPHVLE